MAKQITKFDRTNLKTFRADINAALEAVFAKHNVTGKIGNISFSPDEFRTKITVKTKKSKTENVADARLQFELYAPRFDLTGKEFGKSFKQGRSTYTISGIKPRSPKYPILATDEAGKTMKFPVWFINDVTLKA